MESQQAYSVREAAARLGLSEATIWNLIKRGEIVSISPAGLRKRLIRHRDLLAFLDRQQPVPVATSAE